MKQYIAFIRGINAGLRLKMADLRQLFEELGYKDSVTVLATGNIIFETTEQDVEAIAHRIEHAISTTYNYSTIVVLLTRPELARLVATNPFKNITPSIHKTPHISFTKKGAGKLPFNLPYEIPQKGYTIIGMTDGAVYSLLDLSGGTQPHLLAVLDRAFTKKVTTRNWKTVERCWQAMQARTPQL